MTDVANRDKAAAADPAAVDLDALAESWNETRSISFEEFEALIAAIEALREREASLFEAVRHGDTEHEAWLEQATTDHFAGRPVARPTGKGNKERAEAAETRVLALEAAFEFIMDMEGQDGMTDALFTEKVLALAHITLAATPADALKRARAMEAVFVAARAILVETNSPRAQTLRAKLDALGKEAA